MPAVLETKRATSPRERPRPGVVLPFGETIFLPPYDTISHNRRRNGRGQGHVRQNGRLNSTRRPPEVQAQLADELLETVPPPRLVVVRHPETYQNAFNRQNLPKDEIMKNLRKDREVTYTVNGQWQSYYRTDRLAALLLKYPLSRRTIYESNTVRAAHMFGDLNQAFDYISEIPPWMLERKESIADNLINEQSLGLSDPYYANRYKELAHFYYDRLKMNQLPLKERFFKKPVQKITAREKAFIHKLTRAYSYTLPGQASPYKVYPNRELLTHIGKYGESLYEVYLRALAFWEREKENFQKPGHVTVLLTHGTFMLYLWAVASGIRIDPNHPEGNEEAFARIEAFQRDYQHRIWNGTQMTYEFDVKTNEWVLKTHDVIEDDDLERFKAEKKHDLNYRQKSIMERERQMVGA